MVGGHEVVGRKRVVWRLLTNLILRPRVDVVVGAPIDVGALVGHVDDPPPEAVRRAADLVMGELMVADVRVQVMFSLSHDFENYTVFKPHGPQHEKAANTMLGQVVSWATALRSVRGKA